MKVASYLRIQLEMTGPCLYSDMSVTFMYPLDFLVELTSQRRNFTNFIVSSRIHRRKKLYKLLKRAMPEETTPNTLEVLQELTERCNPCQRVHNAPTRFRVSLGAENVRFAERLLFDVMYLDRKPVLHIVDEGTHLSAASSVKEVSTATLWATILECWATIYTGLLRKILVGFSVW